MSKHTSITEFLKQHLQGEHATSLNAMLSDVIDSCKKIAVAPVQAPRKNWAFLKLGIESRFLLVVVCAASGGDVSIALLARLT